MPDQYAVIGNPGRAQQVSADSCRVCAPDRAGSGLWAPARAQGRVCGDRERIPRPRRARSQRHPAVQGRGVPLRHRAVRARARGTGGEHAQIRWRRDLRRQHRRRRAGERPGAQSRLRHRRPAHSAAGRRRRGARRDRTPARSSSRRSWCSPTARWTRRSGWRKAFAARSRPAPMRRSPAGSSTSSSTPPRPAWRASCRRCRRACSRAARWPTT